MNQHASLLDQPEPPSTAEEVGDDISHALGQSWFFDPHAITVSMTGSTVRLTGKVRSQRERRMAAAAAWSHEGVTDVDNRLQVA